MKSTLRALLAWCHRQAVVLWLLCLLTAIGIAARTDFVADLSAFLPSEPTPQQAVLLDQVNSGAASRWVLIGIEGGDASARQNASRQLANSLRARSEFASVQNGDNAAFKATGEFLFNHRYLLSPSIGPQRFSPEGLRAAIQETTDLLGTPAGSMIKPILWRDPTGETVRMTEAMLPTQSPRTEGGVWVSRSAPRAVLMATTQATGGDLDAQALAIQAVHTQFAPFAAQGLRVTVSGAGTFAVASRTQIQSEVQRLSLWGAGVIVLMLLVAFGGSLRALLLATLPVASGVLAGIAAVSLTFGQVHGITLGFGTTLIGEAVDYAIYYLIQARPSLHATVSSGSGAQRWIAQNWSTVRLGLWTSLCGFAALMFSGFSGLSQLGVFSIAGLSAAAFTTRWVLPVLAPQGAPPKTFALMKPSSPAWAGLTRIGHVWLKRLRWPLSALTAICVLIVVTQPSPWRGSLAALNPIGAEAVAQDTALRADLGATDTGILVAVSAPDQATALVRAEMVGVQLEALVTAGLLQGFDSPARLLPSPATQAARQASLPDTATLIQHLQEATAGGPLPAARLEAFVADVQAARQQPLLERSAFQHTPLASALDAMLVPAQGKRPWRALINVHATAKPIDINRMRTALRSVPTAQVVHIKTELDTLYERYLHEALMQACLGALAVCALLWLQQRSWQRLWRTVKPVGAAIIVVLAGLTLTGVELGILHLVGFLLTAAIGSNYALFFQPTTPSARQVNAERGTWTSLALANLTAVVSFGLLALSPIPALHAIGQVVAPGILLCLVLAAAFHKN